MYGICSHEHFLNAEQNKSSTAQSALRRGEQEIGFPMRTNRGYNIYDRISEMKKNMGLYVLNLLKKRER